MDRKQKNMMKSLRRITSDRQRTNILRNGEQKAIAYLVQKVPAWITSDGLTAIGFVGNLIVASSLILASYFSIYWLFLSVPGFIINWLGDSLDGRLAYYRKIPRKWYGFSLDVTIDWVGIICIGLGYMIYAAGAWKYAGFFFVTLYGWEMITSQLRYKIADKYSIDSGKFGPTEVRILLVLIFITEIIFPTSIHYLATAACVLLLVSNLVETRNLLKLADDRDIADRKAKEEQQDQNHPQKQNA